MNKEQFDKTIDLDKVKSIAIIGDTDSGKTNLGFYYLNSYKGKRKKYLLGYPKQIEGITNISSFNDLFQITDGVIYCDEIQKFIRVYDKKSNYQLMELISLFAHKKNTLIFSTQMTQFITRGVEGFVDVWAIKRIDLESLKNGCKAKRIIERLVDPRKTNWILDLKPEEWYEYSEKNEPGQNRIKKFENQGVGKDWR